MANKIKKWFKNYWDEIVAYLLTFWCTMLSPFLPTLQTADKIKLVKDLMLILFYATIALFLTFAQEYIFPEKEENKNMTNDEKRLAKKKHVVKRFLFAMCFGFGAPTVVYKIIDLITKGIGA